MLRMILGSPRRRVATTTPDAPTANNKDDDMTTTTDPTNTTNHDDNVTDDDDVDSDVAVQVEAPTADDDDLEPWVDWMKRCTHQAEEHMKTLGIEEWIALQRRRKWRWALKIATDTKGKWTLKAMMWNPTKDKRLDARRKPGRPNTRWIDDINHHLQQQNVEPCTINGTTTSWMKYAINGAS